MNHYRLGRESFLHRQAPIAPSSIPLVILAPPHANLADKVAQDEEAAAADNSSHNNCSAATFHIIASVTIAIAR